MTRAEALRALIERVEANETFATLYGLDRAVWETAGEDDAIDFYLHVTAAVVPGSLDAVARLEAPLHERGWQSNTCNLLGRNGGPAWWQAWWAPEGPIDREPTVDAEAPTEARARLLAVLKALLWEAEQAPTPTPPRASCAKTED